MQTGGEIMSRVHGDPELGDMEDVFRGWFVSAMNLWGPRGRDGPGLHGGVLGAGDAPALAALTRLAVDGSSDAQPGRPDPPAQVRLPEDAATAHPGGGSTGHS